MATDDTTASVDIKPGQIVYDEDGTELGRIQGMTERGFEVNIRDGLTKFSLEHRPGKEFGEGYLMWRCTNCGEMGDLENVPEECPNCGAEKEELYAWTED